jgi:hypothetical protein
VGNCENCECKYILVKSLAGVLRTEAGYFREYARVAKLAGGSPGTAQPRPRFSAGHFQPLIENLKKEGFISSSSLLLGSYNNISYAEKLSGEIDRGEHRKDEATPALRAAESLEGAAKALDENADYGFIECVK